MMQLQRFSGNTEDWNEFVRSSANGTLFHRMDFLAYHGGRFRENEAPLAWFRNGVIKALMPLALFKEADGVHARSPYGASYGGIVHRTDLSLAEAEEMVGLLMELLQREGVRRCTLTPAPAIYSAQPSDYIPFFMLRKGFRLVNYDLTAFIPVQADPLRGQFTYTAAKAVRKAQREGVTVRQSTDGDAFFEILLENRSKFSAVPTHTREEVRWLLEHLGEDVRLFMAHLDDIPIAGTLVFRCNANVLLDFYWAHREEYQQHRPVNLLVHEVTRWAAAQGLRWFDFGTQTAGMVPNVGGSRFKETFGSTGIFRNSYQWEAPVARPAAHDEETP